MSNFLQKIKHMFQDSSLRKQVLFVLGTLAVFRVLSVIPIPGVDQVALAQFLDSNQFFGLLNIFSGGGLSTLSIVMLGVGPYITASIIMQLFTMMSPKMKSMYQEEGAIGRKKFSQYSRLLSVPLAFAQAFSFIIILQRQGIVASLDSFALLTNVLVIVAGSVFLMWLGEIMTEFGIGNGLSMIIFAGIVAVVPQVASQVFYAFQIEDLFTYIGLGILALLMVFLVVYITEAERPIPVTYAKQVRGGKTYGGTSTYLPLRLNQAGVIPIIFALSLLLLPQMVLNFLTYLQNPTINEISAFVTALMANQWFYAAAYFVMVFFFTFFYTAVTFDPKAISDNLQKGGAFIPGVRPGESTEAYLGKVVTRITLVGALFLALVAVLPPVLNAITGISYLTIGGTGLLIVVSVVLDIVKKVDAQLSMREY
ncbi:MAG: preprotein translocase subunit SecY [Candidatus Pacebacteria bacterium]|nr:preprotein translocase subunit SecY [Candidatus Paceibacterota bacterium]MBP9818709.1 preprotein translocase subunit SecY [Candidatus Paceibacterota bacterium]